MMRICIIILGLLVLLPSYGFAVPEKAGTTAFDILNVPMHARVVGMGGAYTAMRDDMNSTNVNPASLAYLLHPQIALTHNSWFDNVNIQSIEYTRPVDEEFLGALGFSILYMNTGGIPGYDIDAFGNPLQTANISVSDMLGTVSYSRTIKGNLSAGVNAKILQETLADTTVNSVMLDAGGLYSITSNDNKILFGLVLQNIGSEVSFIDEVFPLPFTIRAGIGLEIPDSKLRLNGDVTHSLQRGVQGSLGMEYGLSDVMLVRAGYDSKNSDHGGVSLGFGLGMGRWIIDYAYVPYSRLGDTHRITLSTQLGEDAASVSMNISVYKERMALRRKERELEQMMKQLIRERESLGTEKTYRKTKKDLKREQEEALRILQEQDINVERDKGKLAIALSGTVFGFGLGSSTLERAAHTKLHEIASLIRAVPECMVEIIGHADDSGDAQYNYDMSVERANNVKKYFVEAEKLPVDIFKVIGYGSKKLVATDTDDIIEQRTKNRRVEIVITKE